MCLPSLVFLPPLVSHCVCVHFSGLPFLDPPGPHSTFSSRPTATIKSNVLNESVSVRSIPKRATRSRVPGRLCHFYVGHKL